MECLVGVVFAVPGVVEFEAEVASGVGGDDVADCGGVEFSELLYHLGVGLFGHLVSFLGFRVDMTALVFLFCVLKGCFCCFSCVFSGSLCWGFCFCVFCGEGGGGGSSINWRSP